MYVFIPDYICTCLRIPLPKTSNSKTQAVAVDAKSPKHHLDMSRKRPKPEPKNCFTLPLESTKTIFWASRNLALEHRFRKPRTAKHKPESLEQQNTSGSLRSEKSQTPGHEPKTAKTRAKKLFHVTFGIHKNNLLGLAKSGRGTPLPKASNSKTQARKPRTAKHKR